MENQINSINKVLCIIIAPIGAIDRKCLDSVMEQDYKNFSVLIHYEKPKVFEHENPSMKRMINVYKNCSHNRNIARKMALTTDADYFLILDSDIELPHSTISKFMLQTGKRKTSCDFPDNKGGIIPSGTDVPEIHIQGGWYPIYGATDGKLAGYPAGKFIKDNTVIRYLSPEHSLIFADWVGLGCCFISREVLEKCEFKDGLDTWLFDYLEKPMIAGECLAFGTDAIEKGYQLYMNGDILCKHHKKGRLRNYFLWSIKNFISKLEFRRFYQWRLPTIPNPL